MPAPWLFPRLNIFERVNEKMARKNPDLHGNAPDKNPLALLLIDVINDLEFEGGERLLKQALTMAPKLAKLKQRAYRAGVPVIYVNDNFGLWRSDFAAQIRHCLEDGVRGEPIARLLLPTERDYFILKPKHSGFFATPLALLLDHLQTKKLILTGMAGDNCVFFTANDAYLRDFELIIPSDCVVSQSVATNNAVLTQMRDLVKARTPASTAIRFPAVSRGRRQ